MVLNMLPTVIEKLVAVSMDDMLKEAMKLGSVKLEQDNWDTKSPWTAEIIFTRRSGTRIHAKGKNSDPWFAMADAINEAREMGAGE